MSGLDMAGFHLTSFDFVVSALKYLFKFYLLEHGDEAPEIYF